MDEKTKKQLNRAIAILRSFCKKQSSCNECPLNYATRSCDVIPEFWNNIGEV